MIRFAWVPLALATSMMVATAAQAEKTLHNPDGFYQSQYYTQAVSFEASELIYLSGQWSYDPDGNLLHQGDLNAQARLSGQNLRGVILATGAKPEDIIKVNVYVKNYREPDLEAVEIALTEAFGTNRDFASTLVGVQSLAREGMLFEIEAVVVPGAGTPR